MKFLTNKYFASILFFIAVLFLTGTKIYAQDVFQTQKSYADSLFDEAKYFENLVKLDQTNSFSEKAKYFESLFTLLS